MSVLPRLTFFVAVLALGAALLPGHAQAFSVATSASSSSPVFVLNSLDDSVSVLDVGTWTEKQRLPTGKQPHHLYMTPDEKSVIVANALSDSLTFIDPRTAQVQRTVRGILDPYHLRFSPDMKWLVSGKLVRQVKVGKSPHGVWTLDHAAR